MSAGTPPAGAPGSGSGSGPAVGSRLLSTSAPAGSAAPESRSALGSRLLKAAEVPKQPATAVLGDAAKGPGATAAAPGATAMALPKAKARAELKADIDAERLPDAAHTGEMLSDAATTTKKLPDAHTVTEGLAEAATASDEPPEARVAMRLLNHLYSKTGPNSALLEESYRLTASARSTVGPFLCTLLLRGGVAPGGARLPFGSFEGEGATKKVARRMAALSVVAHLRNLGFSTEQVRTKPRKP